MRSFAIVAMPRNTLPYSRSIMVNRGNAEAAESVSGSPPWIPVTIMSANRAATSFPPRRRANAVTDSSPFKPGGRLRYDSATRLILPRIDSRSVFRNEPSDPGRARRRSFHQT